jgi:Methyltransferase domain
LTVSAPIGRLSAEGEHRVGPYLWARSRVERLRLSDVLLALAAATGWWNGINIPLFSHPGQAAAFCAFLAVGARAAIHRERVPLPGWLLLAAGGFILAGVLNAAFPVDPGEKAHWLSTESITYALGVGPIDTGSNFGNLFKLEIAIVLLPIAIAVTAQRKASALRWIADAWVLGALLSAAIAVLDGIVGTQIGTHFTHAAASTAYTGRQQGLSEAPNHLAVGCLIVIPLASLWLLRSKGWRIMGWLGLAVLMLAIYVSGSRSALVAAPVAFIVTCEAVKPLRPVGRSIGVWVVLLAALSVLALHIDVLGATRFGSVSAATSDAARTVVRHIATSQFSARPLQGAGFTYFQDAHNIYLQLAASGGVLALVSFATFLVGTLRVTELALRTNEAVLAIGCAIAVAVWLVVGLEENNLADLYLYVPIGLLLAIAAGAEFYRPSQRLASTPPDEPPSRPSSYPPRLIPQTGFDGQSLGPVQQGKRTEEDAMTDRPPARVRRRSATRARVANWLHGHPDLRHRLAPARRARVLSHNWDGARRHPRLAIEYLREGYELDNFGYEISNADGLVPVIATTLGTPAPVVAGYLDECVRDTTLVADLAARMSSRAGREIEPHFARRIGWYIAVRLEKPKLVVETGTHDGVGSALLLRALERNAEDGAPGQLMSFDVEPTSGWLIQPWPRNWTLVIGDTSRTLAEALAGRTVDIFIHDSLHTIDHERLEFRAARHHAAARQVLITDNAHMTTVLREIARHEDASYEQFDEKLLQETWFTGSSLGIALFTAHSPA